MSEVTVTVFCIKPDQNKYSCQVKKKKNHDYLIMFELNEATKLHRAADLGDNFQCHEFYIHIIPIDLLLL